MTEREQELPLAELVRQAEEVNAMHPGISAERQDDRFVVVVRADEADMSSRQIHAYPIWSTGKQRVPDMTLDVYDEPGRPTATFVARFDGTSYRSVEYVQGATVDVVDVVKNAKKGTELFEAYSKLPLRAKEELIPASKVRDVSRDKEGLREALVRAGAGLVMDLLNEDMPQNLNSAQTFAFVTYVLEDLSAHATE